MTNKILTKEESDFFSPQLLAEAVRDELFRVRYCDTMNDIFSQRSAPFVCAMFAPTHDDMRGLLENLASVAREKDILLVCDVGDSDLLAGIATTLAEPVFSPDGSLEPKALKHMLDLPEGAEQKAAHFTVLQENQSDHLETMIQAQLRVREANAFFFILFPSPPDPGLLDFALGNCPLILTPKGLYISSETRRIPGSTAHRMLNCFAEYHRLEQKDGLLEAIIEAMPQPVVAGYADGTLIGGNKAFRDLSGYSSHELPALNWLHDVTWPDFQVTQEAMFEAMLTTGRDQEFQTELQTNTGQILPCTVRLYPHAVGDRTFFFHAAYSFSAEESVTSNADKRETFLLRLRLALQRLDRQQGYRFAILVLGIDHAPFSHPDEEALFSDLIARRTTSCLRVLDVPAHFDPEHLFIFLDDIDSTVDAVRVAQRIQNEMARPLVIGQEEREIRCNVGMVLPSIPHPSEDEILQAAQIALRRAQRRGQIAFYDERQNDEALRFLRTEKELREALDNNELTLRFVPVRDVDSGRISGAETALYWNHPQRGMQNAEELLTLMAQSDIRRSLDLWSLEKSCSILDEMQNTGDFFLVQGIGLKSILRRPFLDEAVKEIQSRNFSPGALFLKVQEAWLASHGDILAAFFTQAQTAGLRILLDEFTAGRVSLERLHQLELSGLIPSESLLAHAPLAASVGAVTSESGLALLLPHQIEREIDLALRKYPCQLLGWRDTTSTPLEAQELLDLLAAESDR